LVYPGIKIKAIKGNTLLTDANFNDIRSDLGVKTVPVHAQIGWCVPEAEQSWCDTAVLFHEGLYGIAYLSVVHHSVCVLRKWVRKITL